MSWNWSVGNGIYELREVYGWMAWSGCVRMSLIAVG